MQGTIYALITKIRSLFADTPYSSFTENVNVHLKNEDDSDCNKLIVKEIYFSDKNKTGTIHFCRSGFAISYTDDNNNRVMLHSVNAFRDWNDIYKLGKVNIGTLKRYVFSQTEESGLSAVKFKVIDKETGIEAILSLNDLYAYEGEVCGILIKYSDEDEDYDGSHIPEALQGEAISFDSGYGYDGANPRFDILPYTDTHFIRIEL